MSIRRRTASSTAVIGAVIALCSTPLFAQPDLVVDQSALASSWFVVDRGFTSSSCALVEECIGGPGVRRLLRFDTVMGNIAQTDLVLGDPAGDPRFIWSPCHGHYHFSGFSEYELLDLLGQPVAPGRKQAFCVGDSSPYVSAPWVPPGPLFYCAEQGLQRGWSDHYSAGVDCQWIDVTNVPPGDYVLRVTVNPEGSLTESDYTNNTSTTPVTLPAAEGLPPRPDGRRVPGMPLLARPAGARVQVDYDVTTCPAPDYNLYYGFRSDAWSYSYAGGFCQIGTSGSALVDLPDPAPGYMVWFLVVGVDPFSTPAREGGHGFDSSDHERPLSGVGICPVAQTQSAPVCGTAPATP